MDRLLSCAVFWIDLCVDCLGDHARQCNSIWTIFVCSNSLCDVRLGSFVGMGFGVVSPAAHDYAYSRVSSFGSGRDALVDRNGKDKAIRLRSKRNESMNQQLSSTRVTIHFAMFATIAAGMIGLGQASWNLPLLVFFCSVVAIGYTDQLRWILFPKWLVFIAMVFGAGVAIFGFLSDASANQILAVGNLLVYVQLPLMFQKKSIRVYEQWGVFLLLELVVAALVNDNVLYGVLMLPVLAIGCASMMALAQYASQLRHNESISESTSAWARMLHWLGDRKSVV